MITAIIPLSIKLPLIPFFSILLAAFGMFFALYSDMYFESATWIPYPEKPTIVVAKLVTTIACPRAAGSIILARINQNIAPIPRLTRLSSIRKYDPFASLLNEEFIL